MFAFCATATGAPRRGSSEARRSAGRSRCSSVALLGGAAAPGAPLPRDIPAASEDGAAAPPTQGRPSTRAVSNAVGAQHEPVYSERGLSDLVMHLGQLLSHDLSHTTPIPHSGPRLLRNGRQVDLVFCAGVGESL